MQNGGHLQSNTSISETKGRRAFNFDSIYRFYGAWISEKVLPNIPCHCIHHFGSDLKKMAAISKVVRLSQKLMTGSLLYPVGGATVIIMTRFSLIILLSFIHSCC